MIQTLLLIAASASLPSGKVPSAQDWATCMWKQVPTSADKWLQLEPITYVASQRGDEKAQNLGIRLIAACYPTLAPRATVMPSTYSPTAVRAELNKMRPSVSGPDTVEPRAEICTIRDGARLFGFDWGYVEGSEFRRIIASRFVSSLSDIKAAAEAEAKLGARTCQTIQSDGSLSKP